MNNSVDNKKLGERIRGTTVDHLLSDSVSATDSNIMEQFKQLPDSQPLERKQIAINVLRAVFIKEHYIISV